MALRLIPLTLNRQEQDSGQGPTQPRREKFLSEFTLVIGRGLATMKIL
jgi:hypothetical protein